MSKMNSEILLMRKEEGHPLLTEDNRSSATTEFTKTFFANHTISKIIENYNSWEFLKEGMSAWYLKAKIVYFVFTDDC